MLVHKDTAVKVSLLDLRTNIEPGSEVRIAVQEDIYKKDALDQDILIFKKGDQGVVEILKIHGSPNKLKISYAEGYIRAVNGEVIRIQSEKVKPNFLMEKLHLDDLASKLDSHSSTFGDKDSAEQEPKTISFPGTFYLIEDFIFQY
jgi:hypothetical protein